VREPLVEGLDAARPHPLGNQVANRVVHHGARDAGAQPEAVGEVRAGVELAAADVNCAHVRLTERDEAGIEAVHERAERQEIQGATGRNLQH